MQRYTSDGLPVNGKFTDRKQSDSDLAYRQPPYNLDAEQAIIGAILVNNHALERVLGLVEPEHFFVELHRQLYATSVDLISKGKLASPITLKSFFESAEPLDANTTVLQYMGQLAARAPLPADIPHYAHVVRDMATRRQLVLIGEDITAAAYDSPVDLPPTEQIEEAESRLFSLVERQEREGYVAFEDAIGAALASSLRALNGQRPGLATGLAEVDSRLGGLQPSDLIILAGRPSMGKTALATNMAVTIAKSGKPVGFFSLEMSAEQLATRVLADYVDIAGDKLAGGQYGRDQRDRIQEMAQHARRLPLHIDQTGGLSIAQLSARARRMKRKHGIELIVVDYLQLMHAGKRSENRTQDITAITGGLKTIAKELNIPVLALSQLNRAVEGRDNKRPQLSDLRESGSIEQDADVVMLLYREEYYLDRKRPDSNDMKAFNDWQALRDKASGKAEIDIAKQRRGAIGTAVVQFTSELTRFSNLATSERAVNHVV